MNLIAQVARDYADRRSSIEAEVNSSSSKSQGQFITMLDELNHSVKIPIDEFSEYVRSGKITETGRFPPQKDST